LLVGAASAGALAFSVPPCAAAGAQVTIEVPPGQSKTVRLRYLPRGTQVGVAIDATGKLGVALVSAKQLQSKPPEAVFRGALDRRMSFQVEIPETSDYYLVLDNRRGGEAVKATATIEAVRGGSAPPAPAAPAAPKGI
jgi:hypothetical protein